MLRRRGHRVVFIVEESFEGTLAEKGFEERLMRLDAAVRGATRTRASSGRTSSATRRRSSASRRSSSSRGSSRPTFEALCDGARYVDERLVEIIDEVRARRDRRGQRRLLPGAAGLGPAVGADRLLQPGRDQGPRGPAGVLGLSGRRPKSGWDAYREEYRRALGPLQRTFDEFCRERGAPPLDELEFIHTSPELNLWLYPSEVDYARSEPLGDGWHNLESSVRATDADVGAARAAGARRAARSSISASARSARPTSS